MGYSDDYFKAREEHNSNYLQNFPATYEHNKPVENPYKSEYRLFRLMMFPPAFIISYDHLKFSILASDQNIILQYFIDAHVALSIINGLTIIRYA